MFSQTAPKLLRPLHSLLKDPFKFSAEKSITGPLREYLTHREDYEHVVSLARLYDHARQAALKTMVRIRPLLESKLSASILPESDPSPICRTGFVGETPQLFGMSGAKYLSLTSVQCQLERLYDHFELLRMGYGDALKNDDVGKVLRFLMLNEAFALCVAGIAKVSRQSNGFEIAACGKSSIEMLRATWFARTLDQNSHAGTIALIGRLAHAGATTVEDVWLLTLRILDQDLAISWGRLTEKGRALKSIQHLIDAVSLVAVILVVGARKEPVKMIRGDLDLHRLDFSVVSNVLRRQANALVTDQFIRRIDDTLSVQIEGMSKGLRRYYRALETEFEERDMLREHIGGKFFEKTNIRQRIEDGEDYIERYRIRDGFDRYMVLSGAPSKVDIEFIIWDVQLEHYYFVQVKHALLGEEAFFNAVVEAWQNEIGKGITQLREAKRLLNADQLKETLTERGIEGATSSNSSFILLHNIAQLDFQFTDDGIFLYDWATFRNLLKDAECQVGRSNEEPQLVRLPSPLRIGHPMDVIQRLLAEHPAYQMMAAGVWAAERASTQYHIEGQSIRVKGLAI